MNLIINYMSNNLNIYQINKIYSKHLERKENKLVKKKNNVNKLNKVK